MAACAPRATGSSPLARGLHCHLEGDLRDARIIPARAGFTHHWSLRYCPDWDHPRSRGVYIISSVWNFVSSGSSPLARGLRIQAARQVLVVRIIPARAGFTMTGAVTKSGNADHPRSRGVYWANTQRASNLMGSSPLARGLRRSGTSGRGARGIIPARAGFTRKPSRVEAGRVGSSPLARGLHLRILGIPTTSHPTRPRLHSLPT